MDGIRNNNSGLLSQLSGPISRPLTDQPDGRTAAPPPPPPPPAPPPAQQQVQPATDALSARVQSFRAREAVPSIDREDELRKAVEDVTSMLKDVDSVPFRFDRGAVASLLSNPAGGPLRQLPSPPSPPARQTAALTNEPPAAPPTQRPSQVTSVLNLFGRR